MIRFIKWLFNVPEYGYMTYDPHGLYRRHGRTGMVEVKGHSGWSHLAPTLWMRFRPHESIAAVVMPDGAKLEYSPRNRDGMGEFDFSEWLQLNRGAILEQMIREKYE